MRYLVFLLLVLSCRDNPETDAGVLSKKVEVLEVTGQFALQEGDLLFQDGDCGAFCEAIEAVTHGVNGARLSHVGIVIQGAEARHAVLEATTQGVIESPIDSFLYRSTDQNGKPKVIVGRLKENMRSLIRPAIQAGLQNRGKAYDNIFNLNNDEYYCSELLYFAFKEASGGTPVFQLRPMTYKDPQTGETFPAWVEYFQKLGQQIPEGQPGLNPGSMSRSIYLDIVHVYGEVSGWKPRN